MLTLVIELFWLFLPAGVANMAPVIFRRLSFLSCPVDFNKQLKGQPIFGTHKTYHGFFFGILAAIITVYLQRLAGGPILDYALVDYNQINIFWFGFLMGFGALFGDLIRSFIKRRLKMEPGKLWIPFDQIDWIIGSIAFTFFYFQLSYLMFFLALVLGGILHMLANYLGYLLKIKRAKV